MKVLRFTAVLLLAVGMFSTTAMALPGDDCATAVPVPGGLDPCLDTTPTGPLGSCAAAAGSSSLDDVWMTFVAPATSTRVRTDLSSLGTDSDYLVLKGACGSQTEIGCSEDEVAYLGNICVGGLTVGATYYVRLSGWRAEQGTPPYLFSCGVYNVDIAAAGTCGNGSLECGEGCDPPGPCCSATCQPIQSCGDNVRCGTEACDGTDSAACPGLCNANCTCNLPRCGDNIINQPSEQCDGTGTPLCPAGSYCATNCTCIVGIPAVSEWGLAVLTLIGLVSGTILFGRRRAAVR